MILQLHDSWNVNDIPLVYRPAGFQWTWNEARRAFTLPRSQGRAFMNTNPPLTLVTPSGEWKLISAPAGIRDLNVFLLPPGELQTAIERAKILSKYPLWPPIPWDKFKPTGSGDILNHYYTYSPGCKHTLTAQILNFVGPALAIALAPLTAGLSSFLTTVGAKIVGTVVTSGFLADLANKAIKTQIEAAQTNLSNDVKEAIRKRRNMDGSEERARIKSSYTNAYAAPFGDQFMKGLQTADLATLEAAVQMTNATLDTAKDKCNKKPCDTAGCRATGFLTLRVQYATLLRDAMQAAGVTTPAAYNAKMSAAIDADLKAAGLPEMIDGPSSKKASLGNFLLIGALFSALLKK